MLEEVRIDTATETVKLCQLDKHSDLVEAAIGWAGLNHPVGPAVKDERRLSHPSVLKEAPKERALVGNDVVSAGSRQASDGRISAVRSDYEPRPQLLSAHLTVRPDTDYATALLN